jgi:hypothetical protein
VQLPNQIHQRQQVQEQEQEQELLQEPQPLPLPIHLVVLLRQQSRSLEQVHQRLLKLLQ